MDPSLPRAEALAVGGGRVAAVGTLDEARSAVGPAAPVIDLGDATILPGFIDSHNHMLWTGLQAQLVDLEGAADVDELVSRLRAWAADNPEAPWVVSGEGWHVDDLAEGRYPSRAELDAAGLERPIYLPRGGHAAATCSRALAIAGIDTHTPDPPGGQILRDPDGGEPTGVLLEGPARELVTSHLPPVSDADRRAALAGIQPRYHAAGITRVQEPGLTPAELGAYQTLDLGGELNVRVTAMPLLGAGEEVAEALGRIPGLGVRTGFGSGRLRLGGLKVYFDGAASFGTAYLRDDWPDHPGYRGLLVTSPDVLADVAERCAQEQWSLGVHVVGGGGLDLALEAFAAADRTRSIAGLRFTLIHAYLWPNRQNMRAARALGVVVATQPTMQERFAPVLIRRFGAEAVARATPLRAWHDEGVLVAGGSDSPITPFEPLRGIWQAVTRHSADLGGPLGADERLTVEQALAMYTTNAAQASFSDGDEGALRVGSRADWVALGDDPLACPPDQLRELPVLCTAVDGELVHGVH